jgi:4-amino-4-deoxy-L-arabinose transferase-like glycosyltransferase
MMLTPAADRPWISGTSDNSILSLILDYNGLGRLDGQAGGPQNMGGGGPGGGTTFGGATGPLRLFNEGLGGQAGWLLGFALVAIVALAVATRLRRSDARTGWLIAAGGIFLTTAVAFSFAQGIFHPYYVAQLAPFTAVLVGAGAGWFLSRQRGAGLFAAAALAGGVATELLVLHQLPGQLTWLPAILLLAGAALAVALVFARGRLRGAVLAAALGLLLLAPASWAVQTLDHATQGTFPAGGPSQVGFGGGGPGGGPGGGGPGGTRGGFGGGAPPGAAGGQLGRGTGGPGGGMGGGPFGGENAGLTQAVAYARQHGGGAIAVSSQSGAASAIIQSGSDVAGIGGFSGRESQVTTAWLADAVRNGKVRWVLASGDGGFGGNDGRVGSSQVMAAVAQVGRKVTITSGSSTTTLYDLSGRADALAAAAS